MFEIVDHTADVAFVVRAKNKEDLLKDAADALYYIYFGKLPDKNYSEKRILKIDGLNFEDALISFLNELIFYFEARKLVFSGINNVKFSQNTIEAEVFFSQFSPEQHLPLVHVKAATYGGGKLRVLENGDLDITVILDI